MRDDYQEDLDAAEGRGPPSTPLPLLLLLIGGICLGDEACVRCAIPLPSPTPSTSETAE